MTPLLPCRPAILSPTESFRFMAMYTFTILRTPGGSSSPRRILEIFSSNSAFTTPTCSMATRYFSASRSFSAGSSSTPISCHRSFGTPSRTSSVIFFFFARSISDLSSDISRTADVLPSSSARILP